MRRAVVEAFSCVLAFSGSESGAQPVLRVTFLRRKGSGLVYTAQRSSTVGSFVAMTGSPTVTSIDSQWERVTVEEAFASATSSSAFARVQVSLPQDEEQAALRRRLRLCWDKILSHASSSGAFGSLSTSSSRLTISTPRTAEASCRKRRTGVDLRTTRFITFDWIAP